MSNYDGIRKRAEHLRDLGSPYAAVSHTHLLLILDENAKLRAAVEAAEAWLKAEDESDPSDAVCIRSALAQRDFRVALARLKETT